uniref:Variant surface glycoprotein 1125.5731 n=1 Tax=Trypanosoma brucei TaxID=5691 RepID=A0A1J0RD17_9TRYP|nr:variant surface glycoprotein 1125.5731 [Trypanosoma brucei]
MSQKRADMFTNWSAIAINICTAASPHTTRAAGNTGDTAKEKIMTTCQKAAFTLKIGDTYERLVKEKADTASPLQKQATKKNIAAAAENDAEKTALLEILEKLATAAVFSNRDADEDSSARLLNATNKWRERGALLLGLLKQARLTRSNDDSLFRFASTTLFKLRTGTAKDKGTDCTEQLQKDADGDTVLKPQAYGKSGLKKLLYSTDVELEKLLQVVTATVRPAPHAQTLQAQELGNNGSPAATKSDRQLREAVSR